jgi:CheY-like chemotaxis protein
MRCALFSMPLMNGSQFRARQLANPHRASIPVVVLSGAHHVKRTVRVAAIIPKPFTFDQLLTTLHRVTIDDHVAHAACTPRRMTVIPRLEARRSARLMTDIRRCARAVMSQRAHPGRAPVLQDESVMRPAVLIVEDDPDLRGMMDQLLHLEGFAPITAINGLDALRLLKTGLRVDVILLDLMLPVMDGWAFRRAQRLDPAIADIPVIVLTAAANSRQHELAAAAVFTKPLPFEAVLAAVQKHTTARH